MFFFKKQSQSVNFSFLGTDIHNHILPGLDDGAPDIQTSISLLKSLHNLGFNKVIPTPHTYTSLYPNTKDTIKAAYEELQNHLTHELPGLPIVNEYASEYMVDDYFPNIAPMLLDEIFQLQLQGYIPVLAHPERYPYLLGRPDYFTHLVAIGCELQLNLLSLSDHYGKGPQKMALQILEKKMYTWAGTDTHHVGHIEMLQKLLNHKIIEKIQKYPFMNNMISLK